MSRADGDRPLKRERDGLTLRLGDKGQPRARALQRNQGAGGESDEDDVGVLGVVEGW